MSTDRPLVLGSRGSPLALAQIAIIRDLLARAHPALAIETRIIKTSGDKFTELSLSAGAGKGLFTKEIEDQLLGGEIDLAVHSMKDLPTELPAGLTIGAVPARQDPRDVFIAKRFAAVNDLPRGARVATSSIRRRAQLLSRRPDLQIEEIRGNVETRLRKLAERDELAALILAAAGLKRLGLYETFGAFHWQPLAIEVMLPAVGQGLIAVEVRAADQATAARVAAINDPVAATCGTAERSFLHAIGGGCQLPYAGHATVAGDELRLTGAAFSPDGTDCRRATAGGPVGSAVEIGRRVAERLKV